MIRFGVTKIRVATISRGDATTRTFDLDLPMGVEIQNVTIDNNFVTVFWTIRDIERNPEMESDAT